MSKENNLQAVVSDDTFVSVIIPAYNAEKSIHRCLTALQHQTYSPDFYEVIVVDDGSTDNTADIAKKFPISYLHQGNSGPATARNRGAAMAKGEIILFTDSDCVPDGSWIAAMVSPFSDPLVAAVKGAYRSENPRVMARFAQIEFEERFALLAKQKYIDMVDTYSAGYRREVFLSLGGFDTRFPEANNEDTELSYRLSSLNHAMVFNPDAIVTHLGHPDSVSRYFRLKFSRGYWRMVVYKLFPDKILRDSYTPQSLKLQILTLFLFLLTLPATFLLAPPCYLPAISVFIVYLLSTMPFTVFAIRRDPVVGICSPLLLCVRAVAIGLGAIWGIFHGNLYRFGVTKKHPAN